ncbi:MAG: PaaI family thioesterase [Microthrixaceae bacterium]|nr:PaaI family thioesterase [Microthrixaceae bacterium]
MSDHHLEADDGNGDAEGDRFPQSDLVSRIQRLEQLEITPQRAAFRRVAAEMRDIIESLTSTSTGAAELDAISDELAEIAKVLRTHPKGRVYEGFAELANAGKLTPDNPEVQALAAEMFATFDHSPFIGLANPLSPPMSLHMHDDHVTGSVTFGSAYEGPPGNVHGGYVAAAFDELLGSTQGLSGAQGMTAYLHTDYRSPTPLHTELTLKAWVHDRVDRKIWVRGSIHVGDRLTAECEGLFISMRPGKFTQLLNERAAQEVGDA